MLHTIPAHSFISIIGRVLAPIFKEKGLFPLFDSAYQGYASGDPVKDAYSIRLFQDEGMPNGMMVCQSFAKSMGLYGERVGVRVVYHLPPLLLPHSPHLSLYV